MIKFSKEKVLFLHQLMAEATGGSIGVRDEGLLTRRLKELLPDSVMRSFIRPRKKKVQDLAIH